MTNTQPNERPPRKLRLWPGVTAALAMLLVQFVAPLVVPGALAFTVLGGVACGLAVMVWWMLFSRAAWAERLGAAALMIGGLLATSRIVHISIATGMMGMMLPVVSIPVLGLALVIWAVATSRLANGPRRISMVISILLACGVFTLLRTGGITGEGNSDFHWRWTKTPEERLLAGIANQPVTPAAAPAPAASVTPVPAEGEPEESIPARAAATPHEAARAAGGNEAAIPAAASAASWPGFRGPRRDSAIPGVRIETDWSRLPPVQLWRRPIGPGWSSFAVGGGLLYTQEQRGDDEVVSSYKLTSGEPVWQHREAVRFWESNGGAGPRATPTLDHGRVYTFGATGILNVLDAGNGAVVWSRNVAADTDTTVPEWGFASSPLVIDDLVVIAASGTLVAYDLATGHQRWSGPKHGGSYSSPHRSTLDGVPQILLLNGAGATSVAPGNGALLWEYAWPGTTIVQPALIADGGVLINSVGGSGGAGTRRLAIAHGPGGWTAEERWTSTGLKPYFNDLVVHKGHAYGFDGSILACIDLADGKRTWKGGRYGNGQLILLPDQDLLLVLSEEGELALVEAGPDQFKELARFPAIEGKTWNHPALAGDVLLVRNGEEMVAFRLSLAGR